jgi:thiol:disulfide interchange protein DsbC
VNVLAQNNSPQLQGLNLTTLMTDKGLIYADLEKGIFFSNIKPMIVANGGMHLDISDKQFYAKYINAIDDKIIYKAPNERLVVQMFTDISCGWCAKVHQDIDSYTRQGITLEFILFPRNGLNTEVARQMATIAASESPIELLQAAFNGTYIPPSQINQTLLEHYSSGVGIGVTGTPAMFVNGYPIDGFLPADKIVVSFGYEVIQ